MDAWFEHPEFRQFVNEKWNNYDVHGWGGFVLKEKLKRLKEDVKDWNRRVFDKVKKRIEGMRDSIFELDLNDDIFGLDEDEVIKRNREGALLLQDTKLWSITMQQKAKLKWFNYGDVNSAYFHRFINGRRSRNEIHGISIDGVWSQEVNQVKDFIRKKFEYHFKSGGDRSFRIQAEHLGPKVLAEESRRLTEPFSESEVLEVLKSRGEFKSPGPDGFNSTSLENVGIR